MMEKIINKLVKKKTKINRDIGKKYYDRESNEEEINKFIKEM